MSSARALQVGLASSIGEVDEVPASNANMVLASKPFDLAITISFSSGTGRVVVSNAPDCDVGVCQGAEGARETGLFGCGMRNCGGPAGIASPPDTGARCCVAAPLIGIGLAPSTDSEVAVAELAAASRVILLVEVIGAVVSPWRARLCCLARLNRFSG